MVTASTPQAGSRPSRRAIATAVAIAGERALAVSLAHMTRSTGCCDLGQSACADGMGLAVLGLVVRLSAAILGTVLSQQYLPGLKNREKLNELEPLREPAPRGLLLANQQRPERRREAGDAAGQRHLRRRRSGRVPAALLERLPVRHAELRGHYVRPRSAYGQRLLALGRSEHSERRHRAACRRRRRVRLGAPTGRLSAPERRQDGVLRRRRPAAGPREASLHLRGPRPRRREDRD